MYFIITLLSTVIVCYGFLLLYIIRNELEQSDYKLIIVAGLDGRKTLLPFDFRCGIFSNETMTVVKSNVSIFALSCISYGK